MTKEEMIKKVETASEIHEKLQAYPIYERDQVLNFVHQFLESDWQKHHSEKTEAYTSNCVSGSPRPL